MGMHLSGYGILLLRTMSGRLIPGRRRRTMLAAERDSAWSLILRAPPRIHGDSEPIYPSSLAAPCTKELLDLLKLSNIATARAVRETVRPLQHHQGRSNLKAA